MHLIKFLLCLLFHPSNVIHCQVNPPVHPAEELPVEVGKQALLLLKPKQQAKKIKWVCFPDKRLCAVESSNSVYETIF